MRGECRNKDEALLLRYFGFAEPNLIFYKYRKTPDTKQVCFIISAKTTTYYYISTHNEGAIIKRKDAANVLVLCRTCVLYSEIYKERAITYSFFATVRHGRAP